MVRRIDGYRVKQLKSHVPDFDGRLYLASDPAGRSRLFPSITTLLKHTSDMTWLQEWKDRVGEEQAKRTTKWATDFGTDVHLLAELLLAARTRDFDTLRAFSSPFTKLIIKANLKGLKRIGQVYLQEAALCSIRMGLAGRVDVICDFDGVLSILDFKTAKAQKDHFEGYHVQVDAYAKMLKEMTGVEVKQTVIFFVLPEGSRPVVTPVGEYYPNLSDRLSRFYQDHRQVLTWARGDLSKFTPAQLETVTQ